MARPTKRRRICQMPQTIEFSPDTSKKTVSVELAIDEYEAIRLIDNLGFTQEDCAAQMNVARTTVQSIYDSARKKIADALVNGKRLVIRGGCYDVCVNAAKCCGKNCAQPDCLARKCDLGNPQCESCKSINQ